MLAVVVPRAAGEFLFRCFDRGLVEAFVDLGLFFDRNGDRLRYGQSRELGRREGARAIEPEGRRDQRLVLVDSDVAAIAAFDLCKVARFWLRT